MHVIRRRGWELPERLATPEHLFFDRRAFLAAGGAAALSLRRKLPRRSASPTCRTRPGPLSGQAQREIHPRPSHDRREDQQQLQQLLRVRLHQADRQGGAGAEAAAMDDQARRHGREAAGNRHRRLSQDAAGRTALSVALCRGLVDGDPLVRVPDGQAGGIGEAVVVGEIRADGDVPRSEVAPASARPGIRGPMSRASPSRRRPTNSRLW